MKDRIVQYPRRYRAIPVAGQENVFDFVPEPGTITEAGTPLNKGTLLSDETVGMLGLDGGCAVIDDALVSALGLESYLAFAAEVNENSLDAAFGKGNELHVRGIGKALAMYAWYNGESKQDHPYARLFRKATLAEILKSPQAIDEITGSPHIMTIMSLSPYVRQRSGGRIVHYLYKDGAINSSTYPPLKLLSVSGEGGTSVTFQSDRIALRGRLNRGDCFSLGFEGAENVSSIAPGCLICTASYLVDRNSEPIGWNDGPTGVFSAKYEFAASSDPIENVLPVKLNDVRIAFFSRSTVDGTHWVSSDITELKIVI